jgi:hypothetical protein
MAQQLGGTLRLTHPSTRTLRDEAAQRRLCQTLAPMKNIQVIDGAVNSVYDIFEATEEEFSLIFPEGQDIAFIDEVYQRGNTKALDKAFKAIWERRIPKRTAHGIHGTLFYELEGKKVYYPTRKDEEATNPNGSRLR